MRIDPISPGVFEKRLSPRQLGEAEAVRRLRDEAHLLDVLGGRVTPKLLARGEDERGPWLRTEVVPFPTLLERLTASAAPLPSDWIERAVRSSFAALAALHEASDAAGPLGIIHADVSPANIAIDDAGDRAVLLDLGLACFRDSLPRDGAFRGTVGYAAPEIARGEVPTPRSDLFSLAATLLHAVTGQVPRQAPLMAVAIASAAEVPILDDRVAGLAERGPGHAAIVSCLAHEPENRPTSARSVLLELP